MSPFWAALGPKPTSTVPRQSFRGTVQWGCRKGTQSATVRVQGTKRQPFHEEYTAGDSPYARQDSPEPRSDEALLRKAASGKQHAAHPPALICRKQRHNIGQARVDRRASWIFDELNMPVHVKNVAPAGDMVEQRCRARSAQIVQHDKGRALRRRRSAGIVDVRNQEAFNALPEPVDGVAVAIAVAYSVRCREERAT